MTPLTSASAPEFDTTRIWPTNHHLAEITARRIGFDCQSGRTITGTWTGIPLEYLLTLAPDPTTHLLGHSRDGALACIPIPTAITALLATSTQSKPDRTAAMPRLVGPDLEGPHTIKRVRRLEAITLPADTDPISLDHLPPRPASQVPG